jgi:neural Wiskott-Aldrich syndrome protein
MVILNSERRRTRAIKRGGQHPEWDEEIRFTLLEDNGEAERAVDDETPPPPPPKHGKHAKTIKGGNTMLLSCWADDSRDPDLIGEAIIDLTEVLTKGETDGRSL